VNELCILLHGTEASTTAGAETVEPRNNNTWWIDDTGRWLNFGEEYASRFPDCYFPQAEHRHGPAFEMLGMIKVTSYTGFMDIQWDVRNVTPGALSAILDHLLSLESPGNSPVMIALKFYFGAWNSELYESPGNAMERLIELSEYAHAMPGESITIAGVDLSTIGRSHSLLRACFDRWQKMDGVLEGDSSFGLGKMKNHILIMGTDSLGERLIYKSVGPQSVASYVLGENWRYFALGLPADRCNSDNDYEIEVLADYPDVMGSGEPRLDHIRAYFRLHDEDPVWLNYERLLLPWKTRSGEPMVMCLSQFAQNLAVPFLEAAIEQAA